MSVVSIAEATDTGGGDETATTRTHERKFYITTDSASDNDATIRAERLSILPRANDTFPGDTGAICMNVAIKRRDVYEWEATANYQFVGDTGGTDGTDANIYPWKLPPFNISTSAEPYQEAVEKAYDTTDAQGAPTIAILNSADDKFDPPVMDNKYNTILRFSYNLQTYSMLWPQAYVNTLNKDAMRILDINCPAKLALMRDMTGTQKTVKDSSGNKDLSYWEVAIEILMALDGFNAKPLQCGFYFKPAAGEKQEIRVKDKVFGAWYGDTRAVPVTEPQLLTSTGALAALTHPPTTAYGDFQVKFAKDWSILNLPVTVV